MMKRVIRKAMSAKKKSNFNKGKPGLGGDYWIYHCVTNFFIKKQTMIWGHKSLFWIKKSHFFRNFIHNLKRLSRLEADTILILIGQIMNH